MTTVHDRKPLPDLPCRDIVEVVTAYLENELEDDLRQRFEYHLTTCEVRRVCRADAPHDRDRGRVDRARAASLRAPRGTAERLRRLGAHSLSPIGGRKDP